MCITHQELRTEREKALFLLQQMKLKEKEIATRAVRIDRRTVKFIPAGKSDSALKNKKHKIIPKQDREMLDFYFYDFPFAETDEEEFINLKY